jgi:hypothetical protein
MGARKADRFWSAGAPAPIFAGVPESGIVVSQSKTLRARGGAAFYRCPPFASLDPGCHFDIHDGDYGTSRSGQKTYGRFFGTIFLGGAGSAFVVERQWIAADKNTKKRKNAKKSAK